MSASRRIRAVGAWWHLLFVVLALGVFAMHTVGHPDSGSGTAHPGSASDTAPAAPAHASAMGTGTASPEASAASSPSMTPPAAGRAAAGGDVRAADGVVATGREASAEHDMPASPASGMAMDMVSLCVAVLGAWILARLLRSALGRRTEWLVLLRAGALAALRPNPPPRGPDLIRLSILRI
ncbi:hypothetical protein ACWEFL_35210 [Streptomyces sp. NPDC004838]